MGPAAGSLVALLLVSLAAPVVCVQRNVSWTVSGVSAYRSPSTPLSVNIGDTLVLQCPPSSYSSVYLMYSVQQYDACDVSAGGGGYLLLSYCLGTPQVHTRMISVIENSNTVAGVPDFRSGRTYYLASFGNMTNPNYYSVSGGECPLGLKMVVYIPCGDNCSRCDSTTLPSRCLECNPGYCLDNFTSTCVPSRFSDCIVCRSAAGSNQVCTACANGLVVINGICSVNTDGDTTASTFSLTSITEGDSSLNTLSSATIIVIAAGAGGGLLVTLLLFSCCVLLYCYCKPQSKVGVMVPTADSFLKTFITKQEIAEIPSSTTMNGNETVSQKCIDTSRISNVDRAIYGDSEIIHGGLPSQSSVQYKQSMEYKTAAVDVRIRPGSHISEQAVNKQLADKERVAAAMENDHLLELVNQCLKI